jgi:hypothetical protein
MPPELRERPGHIPNTFELEASKVRANIFELGLVLWRLAQHKPTIYGEFCARSACTAFPCFTCKEYHHNPIELPPCNSDVPKYFADIIERCRSAEPSKRSPSQELETPFPVSAHHTPMSARDVVSSMATKTKFFWTTCDEYEENCRDVHYHCNSRYSADFDVSVQYYELGIRCYLPGEHDMRKIRLLNGRFVDVT